MNCKPGDLAYIVNCSIQENNDHFVTVVRLDELLTKQCCQPIWRVQSASLVRNAGGELVTAGTIQDCKLRPIRGNLGPEEFTDLAPVPRKVVT